MLRKHIAHFPTSLAGLALAIASLGWCWENAFFLNGMAQYMGAFIAAVLLVILMTKFSISPKVFLSEIQHPVVGSAIPTFAMAMMIISKAVADWSLTFGQSLWLIAIVLHLSFLSLFVFYRCRDFKLAHMIPGWFVPPVGIIVAAASFPGGTMLLPLAHGLLYFGMTSYMLMLPVMIYRFIFESEIDDVAKPSIAILAAPASLSLVGYLNLVAQPSPEIVIGLLAIALLMTLVIYISFIKLMQLPFSPGFAAYTFPMVIGATALFKVVSWMQHFQVKLASIVVLKYMAMAELIIASLIVFYVAFCFVKFLKQKIALPIETV